MTTHTAAEIKQHVTVYVRVFAALLVLTVLTVGVSYVKMPVAAGIAVALAIATLKAGLVASFFMHLSTEKRIILLTLALTAVFFVVLLIYPALHAR